MPSIPANLDWLFLVIGGLLALGSLYLLFWSLLRDRARAKFRCPKCWYDLTPPDGAPPPLPITCSECGRSITKPRDLRKRRRRWRYVLLAIVLLLTTPCIAFYPRVKRNGWLSITPTWVLIDTMPIFGYPSPLTDELARRCGLSQNGVPSVVSVSKKWWVPVNAQSAPFRSTRAYLAHRMARGIPFARPISPPWQASYGAFHNEFFFCLFNFRLMDDDLLPDDAEGDPVIAPALREMYDIPVDVQFRTRPVWPEGVPLYVEVSSRSWWAWPQFRRFRIQSTGSLGTWYQVERPEYFVLDEPIHRDARSLDLDVHIDSYDGAGSDVEWIERQRRSVSVPYRVEGTIDQIMTPVRDPAIDAFFGSMVIDGGAEIRDYKMAPTQTQQTQGIAFGVLIDYCLDGELQAVERVWWIGGPPRERTLWRNLGREWVDDPRLKPQDQRRTVASAKPGENWTVRIRSDPETALRVIDADKYWQGDVTIPLTIR